MVISGKSGFSSSSFLSSSLSPLCVRGERAGRWAVGAPIRRRIFSATNPRSRTFGGQSEAKDFRRPVRGHGFSAASPRPGIFGGQSEAKDFRRRLDGQGAADCDRGAIHFPMVWFGKIQWLGFIKIWRYIRHNNGMPLSNSECILYTSFRHN